MLHLSTFSRVAALACIFFHIVVESFTPCPLDRSTTSPTTALSVSFSSAGDIPEDGHPNRRAEFIGLEPIKETPARQERMKMNKEIDHQFVKYGDDLWALRRIMNRLRRRLLTIIDDEHREKEEKVREQIREIEKQDPELVYHIELKKLKAADAEKRTSDAERHAEKAMAARTCLPAYNLEGLWVGKYGHHGYEMIVR